MSVKYPYSLDGFLGITVSDTAGGGDDSRREEASTGRFGKITVWTRWTAPSTLMRNRASAQDILVTPP